MSANNAASRLLNLLLLGKTLSPQLTVAQGWSEVIRTGLGTPEFLDRLGHVMQLPRQIEVSLATESIDAATSRYISTQMYSALTQTKFSGPWETVLGYLDDHLINYLQMASLLLEGKRRTSQLSDQEIDQLVLSFNDIYVQVSESALPPRLKASILRQLRTILDALENYYLTGAEPVLQGIEAMCGHTAVDDEYKGFLRDHELGQRIRECLSAAADVVTVAVGIPVLAQGMGLLQHF